ncbi:Uncharacterised protein [Bordetella pertussis]|nr:Uncharacterised protein [Bordetella pertussis]CFV97924.1 Uncharacterised protein [Bordetella pertussis]CPJ11795.1 Uncharacterised protein [Bordetella pertussis]CPK11932.1 Uncharacterised protein [Bordetella pertussis]CPM34009.1 Uncharacterised protein [Bordetella pertussis]
MFCAFRDEAGVSRNAGNWNTMPNSTCTNSDCHGPTDIGHLRNSTP